MYWVYKLYDSMHNYYNVKILLIVIEGSRARVAYLPQMQMQEIV